MMLTVDENGNDATEAGFDPENIVQWGFEPQRDDLRGRARTGGPAPRRRRRQDRPDPRRLGGRVEVLLRRHVDGPLHHDRARSSTARVQPRRLPVLLRQGRDERELPVVDLRRRRRRRRLEPGCHPVVPTAQTTPPSTPTRSAILKDTKHPDAAFTVLTYLLARGLDELLASTAAMPARSRPSRTPSADAPGATSRRPSTGRSPRTASSSPTSRTSSRTCPSTTRPSTIARARTRRKWQTTAGLDIDAEIDDLRERDPGHLGQGCR